MKRYQRWGWLVAVCLLCTIASRAQEHTSELYPGTDMDANVPTWVNINAMIYSSGGRYVGLQRDLHSAVYDPGTNMMIIFGGQLPGLANPDGTVAFQNLNDVWALTNANGLGGAPQWTNLIANGASGSPPARHGQKAVYDAANDRMMIFAGCEGFCDPITSPGEVWVLANASGSGGTPTWEQLSISGPAPASRETSAAVYDPGTNSMIIFGGHGRTGGCNQAGDFFGDTWVLSNANGLGGSPAWTQLSPTGGPPLGQFGPSAVYDSVNNIMTVFGGGTPGACGGPATNAVWTLSHANGQGGTPVWSNIVPDGTPGAPSRRGGHTAVYDPDSNRMIIFAGGTGGSNVDGNDVWVLSNANGLGGTPSWHKLVPRGTPPAPRDSHTAVYDTTHKRMVIFGGTGLEGEFWSTWALTPVSTFSPVPLEEDEPEVAGSEP